MALKELSEQQIKMLRSPLPEAAVSKHPTKTYLSSIKAIYVVERLNQVFGIGKWEQVSVVIDNKTSMIVVSSNLIIEDYGIKLHSFGGNDNGGENSKNFDLGDAYKGATTDALTKMCSFLEIGMMVFKGQGNKPVPEKEAFNLDRKDFNAVHKAISEGTRTIVALEEKFTVSDAIKKVLTSPYNAK